MWLLRNSYSLVLLLAACASGPEYSGKGPVPLHDLSGVFTDVDGGTDGGALDADGGLIIPFVDMARDTTSCTGGGTACMSGNPGACDPGIVTCMGTLAVCTPTSTVQSCYTGTPSTMGVGVCKAGTQSCVGALGACESQVLPAAKEDCSNDLDDDCDGAVNNGCPDTIGTGALRYVTPLAGVTGNANEIAQEKRCPQDAFVVEGFLQYDDPNQQLSGIQFSCAKATLTRGAGGAYTLGTAAVAPAPYDDFMNAGAAVSTGTPIDAKCAATGLQALVAATADNDPGGFVGAFLRCGTGAATLHADNTLTIAMTANTYTITPTTTADGTGFDYGPFTGSVITTWACNPGEVLVGWKGVVAASIDQMQAICAPLVTRYK